MASSASMRAQIGTLIIATSGIQLANGFFNPHSPDEAAFLSAVAVILS